VEEHRNKLFDAVIIAIGIASVLIANVTFLGFLTPPGLADKPYWSDCAVNFAVYSGFVFMNGFALVFSLAALASVTFVPCIFLFRAPATMKEWRKRATFVGLAFLLLSLTSFLGAFACSGLVIAQWQLPQPCKPLKCNEAGITCQASTFSVNPPLSVAELFAFNLSTPMATLNSLTAIKDEPWLCRRLNRLSCHEGSCFIDESIDYNSSDYTIICSEYRLQRAAALHFFNTLSFNNSLYLPLERKTKFTFEVPELHSNNTSTGKPRNIYPLPCSPGLAERLIRNEDRLELLPALAENSTFTMSLLERHSTYDDDGAFVYNRSKVHAREIKYYDVLNTVSVTPYYIFSYAELNYVCSNVHPDKAVYCDVTSRYAVDTDGHPLHISFLKDKEGSLLRAPSSTKGEVVFGVWAMLGCAFCCACIVVVSALI
jgi:hypothetical protein